VDHKHWSLHELWLHAQALVACVALAVVQGPIGILLLLRRH